MAAMQYIGPIRLLPTYLQSATIRTTCVKIHKERSKSVRLVFPGKE